MSAKLPPNEAANMPEFLIIFIRALCLFAATVPDIYSAEISANLIYALFGSRPP